MLLAEAFFVHFPILAGGVDERRGHCASEEDQILEQLSLQQRVWGKEDKAAHRVSPSEHE